MLDQYYSKVIENEDDSKELSLIKQGKVLWTQAYTVTSSFQVDCLSISKQFAFNLKNIGEINC